MASGQKFSLLPSPPATNAATLETITGADATTAENIPVMNFDGGSTDNFMDFYGELRGYGGGGLTLTLPFGAAVTSGNVSWEAALRAIVDDAEDLDTTDHAYDFNTVVDTVPSAVGEVTYAVITFTNGADMDSLADGEAFILRVRREASDTGNDTAAGDAFLHFYGMVLRET